MAVLCRFVRGPKVKDSIKGSTSGQFTARSNRFPPKMEQIAFGAFEELQIVHLKKKSNCRCSH